MSSRTRPILLGITIPCDLQHIEYLISRILILRYHAGTISTLSPAALYISFHSVSNRIIPLVPKYNIGMQNRYVGDIGDFGKYGLLRALTSIGPTPALRLGVVWYLYPNESSNDDGKFIGYLSEGHRQASSLRNCERSLYEALRCIVMNDRRHIASVRSAGILPSDTLFHECPLSYPRYMKRCDRQSLRESWLQGALESTEAADLVFLDPDNGIAGKVLPWDKKGPKYVFMDDLESFYSRGQSLVIYHHLGRHKPAVEQIGSLSNALKSRLNLTHAPYALRYRRGTSRVYFIISQEKHGDGLKNRIDAFLQAPWRNHFDTGL